ncbi:MAG: alpha/beta hydrolase [Acidobacteriota bacterium]
MKGWRRFLLGEFSVARVVRSMVTVPLLIYCSLFLYAYFFSDRVIFQPQPATYRDNAEIIKLTSQDGILISAIYLPNPNADYTILYSHGNAEDLGDILPNLRALHKLGFSVFAYDYHGYGTSQGQPSESNIYHDIDAAYDYLTGKLAIPTDRIISFGHSVGGGPAIDLAARRPIAALVVESSFVTAFRVLTRVSLLPFDKFCNIDKINKVRCPVLIIHGKTDEVISHTHAEVLFQHAPEPKRLFLVEGAGHNNVQWVAGAAYTQTLNDFMQLTRSIKQNP